MRGQGHPENIILPKEKGLALRGKICRIDQPWALQEVRQED
jgi:hypothetical protein